tara:strand:+ start:367 stop:945 length:579 start_codon:yes stop_codon:yes gene_type:complete
MSDVSEQISTDNAKYDVNNFLMIAAIGIILLTCVSSEYTEDGSTGPASKGIWGNGLLAIALFGIIIYAYRRSLQAANKENTSAWSFAMSAIGSAGAPGTMLFISLCIISLNVQYFAEINKGLVAPEFYTYSGLATIIVSVQLMGIYRLFQAKGDNGATMADNASALIYLLSMAGLTNAGIMAIILTFFTTQG